MGEKLIKFGTGGWRAIIGDDFIKSNITKLSQAIADYVIRETEMPEERAIVIGYECRFLSDTAAEWISEVMAANAIKVYILDAPAPTPMIMFTIGHMNLQFGIAVTASHNPSSWNGMKFFFDGGKDATLEVTYVLEQRCLEISSEDIKSVNFQEVVNTGQIEIINPVNYYMDQIMSLLDLKTIREANLRVAIDSIFGSSKDVLPSLLANCRVRTKTIRIGNDAFFGGHLPSPFEANLSELKRLVTDNSFDLGIATDADADRIGIIDERGNYVHANDIMVLLYYYILEYKKVKTPVVRNISTTHILDRIAKHYGQEAVEVNVGFKHIAKGMEDSGAMLGGESSGGMATTGHIRGKDGIYTAALIIEIISAMKRPLSSILNEIYEQFGRLYTVERSYKISAQLKTEITKHLFEENNLPEFPDEVVRISKQDGVKVYFPNDTWILIRFSGTEPVIRIYGEMDSEAKANTSADLMEAHLGLSPAMRTE